MSLPETPRVFNDSCARDEILSNAAERLREINKAFDRRLTSVQRVMNRFGGSKNPTEFSIEVEKAKNFKEISGTLIGILDAVRYARFPRVFCVYFRCC